MNERANRILNSFVFVLVVLLASCGIRQEKSPLENVIDGKWLLKELDCYLANPTTPEENYVINTSLDTILFDFNGRDVDYGVSGTCSVTSDGQYRINFSSTTTGTITIYDLLGGNECNITIFETGGAGNISVKFEITSSYSADLDWTYKTDGSLYMRFPSSFKGSNVSTRCNEDCNCYGKFSRF
jgi:hypothetical protein